ncbi:MAG TPA: MBL fold metallo-hydrolase [Spirochaetia bacterium]|nr:MBL fold metallo-hydrolase [Spirochaetia bacterium]
MKIKFLGAASMVTGSCYFLTGEKTGVMIDYGMFQGKLEETGLNTIKPDIDFDKLTAVVLTHAHLDHCGRLPLLLKYGFRGPIFMTEATKALTELVLYDSAKIAKEEELKGVLFTDEDVEKIMKQSQLVEYDKPFMVGEFEVTLLDAGHILGSASVLIRDVKSGKLISFSGDLGNTPEPLLEPTHWVKKADVAIVESTYGDEIHESRDEVEELAAIVAEAEAEKGTVIIPSFSLQRSQEILYIFDQLKKQGKMAAETPVFLDSPMAIKATEIFRDFPELYNRKLQTQAKTDDPFDFPSLVLCDTIEKSRQIKNLMGTKIIVAGSGMMTGGRVLHHVISFLGDPKTQLVFVGYQADGTMGRQIKDGADTVNIWGNLITVKARIKEIKTMSSHADQGQILTWLGKMEGLSHVILTHGEELPRLVLAEKVRQEFPGVKIDTPMLHNEIDI